jgi:hypothetical protein
MLPYLLREGPVPTWCEVGVWLFWDLEKFRVNAEQLEIETKMFVLNKEMVKDRDKNAAGINEHQLPAKGARKL